jgi:hypothetical protein
LLSKAVDREMSPELTLVYTVLERTVATALKAASDSDEGKDAYAWVTGTGIYADPKYAAYVFSFDGACSCLRINADRLRTMIVEARA